MSVSFWLMKCPRLSTLMPYEEGLVKNKPRVNSLNYLRPLGEDKWAVKIFSRHELTQAELEEAFGQSNVLWSHHQKWFSYPEVKPIAPHDFAPLELDEGLYYTSPMGMASIPHLAGDGLQAAAVVPQY